MVGIVIIYNIGVRVSINSYYTVLPIIVLFNPEHELIKLLLQSLIGQVKHVCIVDNTPESVKDNICKIYSEMDLTVHYIELNDNKGIAYAQNRGIEYANKKSYKHVLLLDQDSVLPPTMVKDLLSAEVKLLQCNIQVAAVGPSFRDAKTNKIVPAIRQDSIFVKRISVDPTSEAPIRCDYIIASGSLIRLEVIMTVGPMMDDLFIDWVDIEWGERCRSYGYQTFMVPSITMKHSIGDGYVSLPSRDVNLHSDFRNYFIVRNAIYLQRIGSVRWKLKVSLLFRVPLYVFFYSYHSKKPLYSFLLLSKAIFDGIVGNMGKGHFK